MSNMVGFVCLLGQLVIMYFSHKMRRDANVKLREVRKLMAQAWFGKRCHDCGHWYAHPENEGRETGCPFKYHPRDAEYCSCWTLREESEC